MAVKIEKGGWITIFLVGAGLVVYALDRYDVVSLSSLFGGSKTTTKIVEQVDPTYPIKTSGKSDTNEVRVRVNIWVGCVGGLVANAATHSCTSFDLIVTSAAR